MKRSTTLAGGLALAATSLVAAQTVTFELIPNTTGALDVSPDGRWVVGTTNSGFSFRWDRTNDVFQTIAGGFSVNAVSNDGETLVGNAAFPGTGEQSAAVWRLGQGITALGALNGEICGSMSNGYDVSADGSTVVGLAWDSCSGRGFVWTEATGMQELEGLANGNNRCSAVSGDGTVFGGFAQGSFSRTPVVWASDGTGTLLDPPNGDALGEVYAINHDGSTVLGNFDYVASRWDDGERTTIGSGFLLPGWASVPMGMSDDETIVGFDYLSTSRRAWIKPAAEPDMIRLLDWVVDNGGIVPDGYGLHVPRGISADGKVIVGFDTFMGGWIITVEDDTPCVGDLDGSGSVGFEDLVGLLAGWGTDGPGADIAAPTDLVEFNDLVALLAGWGPCP